MPSQLKFLLECLMNSHNKDYANRQSKFAKPSIVQITLREMQAMVSSSRFWIGFIAIIAALTVTGPFGTLKTMAVSQRLVFWGVISLVTYFSGMAVSTLATSSTANHKLPDWMNWLIGGIAAGPVVGVLAWFINIAIFETDVDKIFSFMQFIGYTTVIAIVVVTMASLVSKKSTVSLGNHQTNQSSPFLNRLPFHLGKSVVSLEAQDHYIKVTTTKGTELILLRLSDAESELTNYAGLRVHRSWWVATAHIEKVTRKNRKITLKLTNGTLVPVSRSYAKALTKLGIK